MREKYATEWHEVFVEKGQRSTLYVYKNLINGVIDIVQINDKGESIMTRLKHDDVCNLLYSLNVEK